MKIVPILVKKTQHSHPIALSVGSGNAQHAHSAGNTGNASANHTHPSGGGGAHNLSIYKFWMV